MKVLDSIKTAIEGSEFQGRVYVVGGVLRDRLLGRPFSGDLDLMVMGDAVALARYLHRKGLSEHAPVVYPRFGTARIQIDGVAIELASARKESYAPTSRKPSVQQATLEEDVLRRDFTINTLLEGLHDGRILDITGKALPDIEARLIRTPRPPDLTFEEDPLRMLRAVRFATVLEFEIEEGTWEAIKRNRHRIDLLSDGVRVVSAERIRDEFLKIVEAPAASRGLNLLLASGLLDRFLPELSAMRGVEQNEWHCMDVWDHTMSALAALGADAELPVRLAVLFHDVGKPCTRSEDATGVHFYRHETVGAAMTRTALERLRLPRDVIRRTTELVALHMRLGQVRPQWTNAAIRRLIREVGEHLDALFEVARADMSAMSEVARPPDLAAVRARIDALNAEMNAASVESPLTGDEIMEALSVGPGPVVGEAKQHLINLIIEGRLVPEDREGALTAVMEWYRGRSEQAR